MDCCTEREFRCNGLFLYCSRKGDGIRQRRIWRVKACGFLRMREKPARLRLAWELKRASPLCFVKGYVRKLAASVQASRGASSVENFLPLDCMANGG